MDEDGAGGPTKSLSIIQIARFKTRPVGVCAQVRPHEERQDYKLWVRQGADRRG